MPNEISKLADVHPNAVLGEDVSIGPFCVVGPDVELGDRCRLDSNVVITGHTKIGTDNRFWPGVVVGTEPQDVSFEDAPTRVEIGNENQFREGVTVHRGAEKEDHTTRVGDRNLCMANSHIAHNCVVGNDCFLVNGSLLGGHVHLHDRAIISGNTAVHHFSTVGTLAFVSGVSRVVRDVPPYVMAHGADSLKFKTINNVGMDRAGISKETIAIVRSAFKLMFRQRQSVEEVREHFLEELDGVLPIELLKLLDFKEHFLQGRGGRGRNPGAAKPQTDSEQSQRAA